MTRIREERGSTLVVAMIVMLMMLSIGLAAMALSNNQTAASGAEKRSESDFNLVDAVLKTQVYLISKNWPGTATSAYPSSCDQASTGAVCPDPTTVANAYNGGDYSQGESWTTQVRDDGGTVQSYFTTAGASSQPTYDANGNGKVWVRTQATIKGQTRILVAAVKANTSQQPFPHNVVTAGYFGTTNNGNKTIINTKGGAAQPAGLALRCNSPAPSTCANYNPNKGQVSPDTTQFGYTGGNAASSDNLAAYRMVAQTNGTYYASGCPANPAGALVFVENGNCSYSTGKANSQASPGMLVIANGTLSLGGNFTYYGLVYAANLQNSTGYVVSLSGTSGVVGSVAVDGAGGVSAGSSGTNISYDPNVFGAVQGYANASIVPGTWRQLTPAG